MSALDLFACPHCGGQFKNNPQLAGQQVACPKCKQRFKMPVATPDVQENLPVAQLVNPTIRTAQLVSATRQAPPSTPAANTVSCPHCSGGIVNEPSLAGTEVGCPHCNGRVVMPGAVAPRANVASEPLDFLGGAEPSRPEYGAPRGGSYGFRCPFCGYEGRPAVTKQIGATGWILFVVLILFCIPLCWLPFVVDGCKEETRKCRGCGSKLG